MLHYLIFPKNAELQVGDHFDVILGSVNDAHWLSSILSKAIKPMFIWCQSTVYDAGSTSNQHWVNISCLLVVWIIIFLCLLDWHSAGSILPPSVMLIQQWGSVHLNVLSEEIIIHCYLVLSRNSQVNKLHFGWALAHRLRRWPNINPALRELNKQF